MTIGDSNSPLPGNLRPVAARLTCPICLPAQQQPDLMLKRSQLVCTGCGASFELHEGVPVLLSAEFRAAREDLVGSESGRAMVEEYAALELAPPRPEDGAGRKRASLVDLLKPPELMLHNDPDLTAPHTRKLFDHAGPDTRVLNLGGGPSRYRPADITLNLDTFVNVDVVGDAHCIPFKSDTFDSLICNAVLEHVTDPEKVVAEAIRVLRPGGWLYAEVPFIFFFHGYPNDYRRFTLEGMRLLFNGLSEPQYGITNGPISALLQCMNTALQFVAPKGQRWILRILRGVFGWTAFPLKYLDRRLSLRDDAHVMAGGFYVIGRKPG